MHSGDDVTSMYLLKRLYEVIDNRRSGGDVTGDKLVRRMGRQGKGQGQFMCPGGVAVGPAGEVVVADTENHRIKVFDKHGEFLRQFGRIGPEPDQLNHPMGVAVTSDNRIVITDTVNRSVKVFTMEGEFIAMYTGDGMMELPHGVAVSGDDQIVVTDIHRHCVIVLLSNGHVSHSFGHPGNGDTFGKAEGEGRRKSHCCHGDVKHRCCHGNVKVRCSWHGEDLTYSSNHGISESNCSCHGDRHFTGGCRPGKKRLALSDSTTDDSQNGDVMTPVNQNDETLTSSCHSDGLTSVNQTGETLTPGFHGDGMAHVTQKYEKLTVGCQNNDTFTCHVNQNGNIFRHSYHGDTTKLTCNRHGDDQSTPSSDTTMDSSQSSSHGNDNTTLDTPFYVAVNKHKQIIVSDTGSSSVKLFTFSGKLLRIFGWRHFRINTDDTINLYGLCSDSDGNTILICNNMICTLLKNGRLWEILTPSDGLQTPKCLAYSKLGHLVVSDAEHHNVSVYAYNKDDYTSINAEMFYQIDA